MDPSSILGQEGQFPQYQTPEEHDHYLRQQAQQIHESQQHQAQMQQQHMQQQAREQQAREMHQQQSKQQQQTTISLEAVIAMMAENQNKLVEGMNRLMTRLENPILPNPILPKAQDARSTRQNPPHLSNTQRQPHTRATYEPSSPSEGAYARELNRQMIGLKEPRIRDNLRFTGESRTLRQFLLDIYDTLEQFSKRFHH